MKDAPYTREEVEKRKKSADEVHDTLLKEYMRALATIEQQQETIDKLVKLVEDNGRFTAQTIAAARQLSKP